MQATAPRVFVFPTLLRPTSSLPSIILSKSNTEIKPLQGTIEPVDPSCVYTATRVFLKNMYDKEFAHTDVTLRSNLNLWFDETFRYWVGRLVEADFYDDEKGKTYSFILPIDKDFQEITSEKVIEATEEEFSKYCPKEFSLYKEAKQFYEEAEKNNTIKYFGTLNCDISHNWNNHYEALYSGIFRQKGERWLKYSAANLTFPTDEELSKLKGIVVSGADHASYDESIPFHDQLYKLLQKANASYPHLKLLGVCFGCQILAHCLGGKASRMEGLNKPFIAGLENIKANEELKTKKYFKETVEQLNMQCDEFVAVEAHGDHVEKLPEKSVVLASSSSTNVEMWGIEDRVLSVQFHPEFNGPIMKYKVIEGNELEDEEKKKMLQGFDESEKELQLNRDIPVTLCRNFLKSE